MKRMRKQRNKEVRREEGKKEVQTILSNFIYKELSTGGTLCTEKYYIKMCDL